MSICACAPFNPKHSQTEEEDVRAKYNTSRKPNSLPVGVVVETEIIAAGMAPGQGIKNGPLLRSLEASRLESRVGLISPMIARRRGLSLFEIEPSDKKNTQASSPVERSSDAPSL